MNPLPARNSKSRWKGILSKPIPRIRERIQKAGGTNPDNQISMKNLKYWLTALAMAALSACTVENPYKEEEPAVRFQASIEGTETKTYVDGADDIVLHWTAADAISVFGGGADGKYVFQGETGDRGGDFDLESAGSPAQASRFYAVYPYAESNALVSDGVISVTLPAKQKYAEGSFGEGAGWMTAVSGGLQDYHLVFKNVMGFLRLKIYGGAKIDNITFRGNNDEIISGAANIAVSYGGVPVITMTGDGKTVKLNCSNVETGTKESKATPFWIALPPMTFEQGFTVVVKDDYGYETTITTDKPIEITRNHLSTMAAFEVVKQAPPIPDLPVVNSTLPVLYVYTPDNTPIVDKENWITDSHVYLKDTDGKVTDLGTAGIKGRGNTTWNMAKKPYALKLDKKAGLLGMPKDKRWNLLANFVDRTRMRNDVALELGRRLGPDYGQNFLDWTPRGKFVELVLNGEHMGNFYLVEHIKIAEDRVPITEMKSTDIAEPEVTGGWLLELGIEMDEVNKFYTNWFDDTYPYNRHCKDQANNKYRLPVMIKDPDEDVLVPEQFNWIKSYINTLQSDIRWNTNGWTGRVDMDSFICWMFVQEVVGNYEPFHPKSSYMHKDREGKLMMGPLWDFDYATFKKDYAMFPIYHYSIWYPYMLKNATFKARVKALWPIVKPLLRDVEENYIDARAAEIKASAEKDWQKWPSGMEVNLDESLSFDAAVASLKGNLSRRISQMTTEVNNM